MKASNMHHACFSLKGTVFCLSYTKIPSLKHRPSDIIHCCSYSNNYGLPKALSLSGYFKTQFTLTFSYTVLAIMINHFDFHIDYNLVITNNYTLSVILFSSILFLKYLCYFCTFLLELGSNFLSLYQNLPYFNSTTF